MDIENKQPRLIGKILNSIVSGTRVLSLNKIKREYPFCSKKCLLAKNDLMIHD